MADQQNNNGTQQNSNGAQQNNTGAQQNSNGVQQNSNGAQQNTNSATAQQTQVAPIDTNQYTADVDNSTIQTNSKGPFRTFIGGLGKGASGLFLAAGAVQLGIIEWINRTAKNIGKNMRYTGLYSLEEALYKAMGLKMPGKDERKLDDMRSLDL